MEARLTIFLSEAPVIIETILFLMAGVIDSIMVSGLGEVAVSAAGKRKYPLLLSIFSMVFFRVGLSLVLGLYFKIGLISIWIGAFCEWSFCSIMNFIHFKQGKWLTKKVI